jgi:DNA repair photolyase
MKEFKHFYTTTKHRVFNTWCKYTQRLDTYGCGCKHDCNYCYAKSLLTFRGFWNSKKPKIANIHKIKSTIKYIYGNGVIRLGGMTDCFQPLELGEKITYKTIKLLNEYGIHYLIITKSSLVSTDEYISIYDKKLAHFQISISSTDNSISKKYENSSSTSSRIYSIEKLQRNGFDVSVRLSPFIYEYVDFNILNNIKCDKILIEFLKVNWFIRNCFNIDYSKYTHKYGGYENLELSKKIELVNKITGFNQKSVGEYVKSHYEYFRDNINYNKEDCCNLSIGN